MYRSLLAVEIIICLSSGHLLDIHLFAKKHHSINGRVDLFRKVKMTAMSIEEQAYHMIFLPSETNITYFMAHNQFIRLIKKEIRLIDQIKFRHDLLLLQDYIYMNIEIIK